MQISMALFPLVGLIALGYILKNSHFVTEDFWRGGEKINYFILFPILLFNNLAFVDLDLQKMTMALVVVGLVVFGISIILWCLKFIFNWPMGNFGVFVQSHIRFNTYIGLSLMSLLFGKLGMQIFSIIIAIAIPMVNIISVLSLTSQNNLKNTLITIIKNPLILGCIAGIGFNYTSLTLFSGLQSFIQLLASLSLPLGLLSVGAALQFSQLKTGCLALILNSISRLLLVPIFAYGMATIMQLSQLETMIVTVFFALPTASASYMLTRHLQGNYQLMAAVISLQTLLFAVSFPILMWLLFA